MNVERNEVVAVFKKLSRVFAAVFASACLALALVPFAYADSSSIVTLGADLTSDQRAQVLSFFGLSEKDLSSLDVITVTNQDEHSYCDATIPSSVTGSRTLSCSYIQPTTSGGIKVRTANLTYVTSETLYNALQTAGVKNCNLVVTAPFEVSGTGALTGVFMAYEQQGETIDSDKAETAVEEMYETASLESQYGTDVVEAISDAKNDIASAADDLSEAEIEQIVSEAASEHGVNLSQEDLEKVSDLMGKIQDLDYDSNAFADTFDKVSGAISDGMGIWDKIVNFFSGLFGGSNNIIDNLNTDVFSLDK